MKKLTIVLLSSLGISCFMATAFANCGCEKEQVGSSGYEGQLVYRGCKWPCYLDKGIDLEAECKSPWCAKNKPYGAEENDKYSLEWYK